MQPSPAPVQGKLGRERLLRIAKRQSAVIIGVAAYLGAVVLAQFIPQALVPVLGALTLVGTAVAVYWLAESIYGKGVGLVLGIVTLIPLVGLLVLVVVSGRATRILKQHGIRVGFTGADMTQFYGPGQPGRGPGPGPGAGGSAS